MLPVEIFSTLQIEILDVRNNLLRNIPIQILLCKQCLVYLNLSKNHIQAINEIIPQLKSLKSLIINGNDFDSLPKNFLQFENQLKEFSIDWFKYCRPPLIEHQDDLKQFFLKLKQNSSNSSINLSQFISIFSTDLTLGISSTTMHKTIIDEDISVLRYILGKYQYLCDEEDRDKHTPLSLAIKEEKYFAAKILILGKCNVVRGGGQYGSCLALAVLKIQFYLVRDLLKIGAFVDQKDYNGNTPLHYCFLIFNQDPKELYHIANFLLQNNANPNIINDELWTPIHLAIRKGYIEALKFVIEYNQKCKSQKFNLSILGGSNKLSLLYLASFNGQTQMVQLLLQHEPNSFVYLANYNIFINVSHRHTTISKLLIISKQKFIQKNIIFKEELKEQQSNNQKFRQVRTNHNYIASKKCEENEEDPSNGEDPQFIKTQSPRSLKISQKRTFIKGKRILIKIPNENRSSSTYLSPKKSKNITLTIETQENFDEDDILEDYDWQIQIKQKPYYIAIGVEGLDNISNQNKQGIQIKQQKIIMNRKFQQQYHQINSNMIEKSTKIKNNIINNDCSLSKRLGYINVFHHFLDLALDLLGQMTGISLYQIQVNGLLMFKNYEMQDQNFFRLLNNIQDMFQYYKEIYNFLYKKKDFDSINLQHALTSRYPQTLSQYNHNSITTQYNLTNDIWCNGKKQKDDLKYLATESEFENSFVEQVEVHKNEIDIQTQFKNYIIHIKDKPKFNSIKN